MIHDFGAGADAVKEILLDGGDLQFATFPDVQGDVKLVTYASLGYTDKDNGGTLSVKQPTFHDVKVTGLTDPAKRKATGREVTLKVILRQTTLNNLAIAMGGKAADVVAGVLVAGKSDDATIHMYRYVVHNSDDATKDYAIYIPKGKIADAVDVQFADEKETGLQLTISAQEVTGKETPTLKHGTTDLTGARIVIEQGTFA